MKVEWRPRDIQDRGRRRHFHPQHAPTTLYLTQRNRPPGDVPQMQYNRLRTTTAIVATLFALSAKSQPAEQTDPDKPIQVTSTVTMPRQLVAAACNTTVGQWGGKRLSFQGVTLLYTVDSSIWGIQCLWKNLDTGDVKDSTVLGLAYTHDRPTVATIRRYLESHGVVVGAEPPWNKSAAHNRE